MRPLAISSRIFCDGSVVLLVVKMQGTDMPVMIDGLDLDLPEGVFVSEEDYSFREHLEHVVGKVVSEKLRSVSAFRPMTVSAGISRLLDRTITNTEGEYTDRNAYSASTLWAFSPPPRHSRSHGRGSLLEGTTTTTTTTTTAKDNSAKKAQITSRLILDSCWNDVLFTVTVHLAEGVGNATVECSCNLRRTGCAAEKLSLITSPSATVQFSLTPLHAAAHPAQCLS